MKVELKNLHTIILFIGVSGSGKSTMAAQINDIANNKGLKSVILSSDDCRKELLLGNFHHHDIEMNHISDKAFNLLMKKLELYLKWPYNANLIILDAMHLYEEDRQRIIDIAKENCYDLIGIVLDFNEIEEYFLGLDQKYDKKLISRQIRKFHTDTLPNLGKKLYDDIIRIKKKNEKIELDLLAPIKLDDVILSNDKHDFIISDIHECIKSFKALLKKVGFGIEVIHPENGNDTDKQVVVGREDTRIILAGDFIDKGNKTKEIIEFLYDNDRILSVAGGHESFVYRYLKGEAQNRNIDIKFYTSIPILEKDEELKKKFFVLYERMKPFLIGKNFIITHAGCENKYLGKTQERAIRSQRYYHVDRFDDDIDDDIWLADRREKLKYLKDTEFCHPLHIFGHESWKHPLIYKNKMGIDTGCVFGGKLTGIEIDRWTGRYKLYHVNCMDEIVKPDDIKDKLRIFTFEDPKIELDELEDKDYNRLMRLAKNKVNFISGTMCPADKSENKLEDLEKGLNYFKHRKIEKVMLQIKYMGSRCNIYLFDDIEKSYAVSRNGFLIKNIELNNIYKILKNRLNNYFKDNNIELMIIDGELMPWSALGEDLIEPIFNAIDVGIKSELDLLKSNDFERYLSELNKQYKESQFDSDFSHMKKDELYSKYGPQKYEAYKLLSNFYMPCLDEMEDLHNIYKEQLDIFAKPFSNDELHYQPFSILKSVKKNGEEILYFDSSNVELFNLLNDDKMNDGNIQKYIICDLTPDGYRKAKLFFDYVTKTLNLEGIVIKPLKVDIDGCVPFIKVRSPNYLTIIYGFDYLNNVKYSRLLEQKRISKKLDKSEKEWRIGKKLLKIPYRNISEDNMKYLELMTNMIIETNEEFNIDPRL